MVCTKRDSPSKSQAVTEGLGLRAVWPAGAPASRALRAAHCMSVLGFVVQRQRALGAPLGAFPGNFSDGNATALHGLVVVHDLVVLRVSPGLQPHR